MRSGQWEKGVADPKELWARRGKGFPRGRTVFDKGRPYGRGGGVDYLKTNGTFLRL